MKTSQKILILGSTGLVGHELLEIALHDDRVNEVVALVRRPTGVTHAKLTEHIVDFNELEKAAPFIKGDILFSCLGTTLKEAGSKEAQYKVDYTYQYVVAQKAKLNGVKTMVLISSAGARPKSTIFYLRMKGELERSVEKLGFKKLRILRPGPLMGQRKKKRLGEEVLIGLLQHLPAFMGKNLLHPIHGRQVAIRAMELAMKDEEILKIEPKELLNPSV